MRTIGVTLFFILALPLAALAQEQASATTPVIEGDEKSLRALEIKLNEAQKESQAKIEALSGTVSALTKQITDNPLATDAELRKAIKDNEGRLRLLEQINQERTKIELTLDEVQYQAGRTVLETMINKSITLQSEIGLAVNINKFQEAMNPSSNPEFLAQLTSIKASLNKEDSGSDFLKDSPLGNLLANPYLSVAYTVGSMFLSKGKPKEKTEKYNKLFCVIDFTSRNASYSKLISDDIDALKKQLEKFEQETQTHFLNYVGVVGYRDKTWQDYVNESKGGDPVAEHTREFFGGIRRESEKVPGMPITKTSPKIKDVRVQIERVKADLLAYETILRQVDGFRTKYITAMRNSVQDLHALTASNPGCASVAGLDAALKSLVSTAEENQKTFRRGYFEDTTMLIAESTLYRSN
ncbi:MAG TPA: hypothetical protein VN228_10560 [Pyrinomonadaceae bacterium]|nr:hypothetical protein [Pyrinomonadaceae bacterium]